jgi:protocatechuate 3,4-dioxygenase beta subunit
MKQTTLIVLIALISFTGCAQSSSQKNRSTQRVGGQCEGCEAIHESPVAFGKLSHIATLPGYKEKGTKIEVSGIVYQRDSKTPAKDVVIYVYQTDQTGRYPTKGNETGWGKRHGYIRGWVKTNEKGEYTFLTLRPAAYPGRKDPAHIHASIKEPDKNEYWVDAYLFDDDPLLTTYERSRQENRGGDGILRLRSENGILKATRNIILGLHVPNYPVK